jgi:hypothetical protein
VLEADPVLRVVVEIEIVEVDPIPRYPKITMHVEPPHNSPTFPVQGIVPRISLTAMKHW